MGADETVDTAEDEDGAVDVEDKLLTLAKSLFSHPTGDDSSNVRSIDDDAFAGQGIEYIQPPYPPRVLTHIYEHSSALGPPVRAIVNGVAGHGHRWTPSIDMTSSETDKLVASAILAERIFNASSTVGYDDIPLPTPEEVEERKKVIKRGIEIECLQAEQFIMGATKGGWSSLMAKLQNDIEVTGNGYLEVVRNRVTGMPIQVAYAQAITMRIRRQETNPISIKSRIRISDVAFGDVDRQERFRSFVQVLNGQTTYFKEYGDPRVMSARSGRYYPSVDKLPRGDRPATEIIHFDEYSVRSVYGIPVWVNAWMNVLGLRAAEEVNYYIFDNGIPPVVVTVSNGTLGRDAEKVIAAKIREQMKGRKKFHAWLVLEAKTASGAGGMPDPTTKQPIVDVKTLDRDRDGSHLAYMKMCEQVIAMQFGLSSIGRGKTEEAGLNRATAQAAMVHDEEHVYQPRRRRIDDVLNDTIVPDLGLRYVRYTSNTANLIDAEALAKILAMLVEACIITPGDARGFADKVLQGELSLLDADWLKQPIALTLAEHPVQKPSDSGGTTDDPVVNAATAMQRLVGIQHDLQTRQRSAMKRAIQEGAAEDDKPVVIPVGAADWKRMVTPAAAAAP